MPDNKNSSGTNSKDNCQTNVPSHDSLTRNDQEDIYASSDSTRSSRPLLYAKKVTFQESFVLVSGETLPEVTVVYETYGTLNEKKDNAILVCHALSGDSHVAAHDDKDDPGWWDILIGPGKSIDTNRYFVICPNVLGGCRGTTGPDSIDPRTQHPYGMTFPAVAIEDMVDIQKKLIDHLGIKRLLAVIGGSMGGLMVLDWGTRYPDQVLGAIPLASTPHISSQSMAFDIVARNAIMSDPHFHGGQYYDKGTQPATGLAIARMLGHITYLSRESMARKFGDAHNEGRNIKSDFETRFSVGSYLAHQGSKFVERFDANSYLTLSMALDTFELGGTPEELVQTMRKSMCRWLIVTFTSDWLFPPFQSQELVDAAIAGDRRVCFCKIQGDCGHDSFLLENDLEVYGNLIRAFIHHVYEDHLHTRNDKSLTPEHLKPFHFPKPKHRIDFDRILDLIPPKTKILDLGCGKGDLLYQLKESGHERLVGIEIEQNLILSCVEKGLDVIQADLNEGLSAFMDKQFDFVVLSKTLQTVYQVERVLEEMLRVGTRAIISFPNLGYKKFQEEMAHRGRAPQTDPRPGKKWYNTSDVRFLSINDFTDFCSEKDYRIHQTLALDTESGEVVVDNPNWNADVAIMVLSH